ncbi:tail assembly chaperone [Bacillus sp. CLL-7-23]|uniref:Tail assembly chaperone n=1 Tax=Bacillus changyiensis TaxID=3004103 RepID=A0ABT4X9R5_9BACI|nr:tail assembly chaperone [Bacillus changyiensis]MDA7028454.1 tail assembly chaperone [Bacillus changyiensis]
MAYLTIDGKEYKARCDFAFDRTANEKYAKEDKNGDKSGGTLSIYLSLLNDDAVYLSAFWDCALAYLKKGKPSVDQIEEALAKIINDDETGKATDELIKEAFNTLDSAGFFIGKIRQHWKMLEKMTKPKKARANETPEMEAVRLEEDENNKEMLEAMKEAYIEKTGSTMTKSS